MNTIVRTLSFLLFPIILLLILFQFILSNELASVGSKVEKMDMHADITKEENQLLAKQVAMLRSLDTIEQKAKANGFVKAVTFLTISNAQSVALR
jgi:hypothetical protein